MRIDPDETARALKEPGVRLFEVGGRSMKGWLLVGGKAIGDARSLGKWIRRGVDHAASLPKKK